MDFMCMQEIGDDDYIDRFQIEAINVLHRTEPMIGACVDLKKFAKWLVLVAHRDSKSLFYTFMDFNAESKLSSACSSGLMTSSVLPTESTRSKTLRQGTTPDLLVIKKRNRLKTCITSNICSIAAMYGRLHPWCNKISCHCFTRNDSNLWKLIVS